MKKFTHLMFNLGFLSIIALVSGIDLPTRLILAPLFFFGGVLNDALDFRVFSYKEHRNFFTHSFLSPLVFPLFLIPFLLVASFDLTLAILVGIFVVVSFYAHLVLDMLNPTGVFLGRNQKIAGKIRYNNLFWNVFFQIIGGVLFLISLMIV